MTSSTYLSATKNTILQNTCLYSFMPNCRGSNKMHPEGNYQDFLNGHSLTTIK